MACFAEARSRALARLVDSSLDKAPAGGADIAALPLINALNSSRSKSYVTTSTCSGRCVVYARPVDAESGKQSGRWAYSSHDGINADEVFESLDSAASDEQPDEKFSLKYEPPLAHVRCSSAKAADKLIQCALRCGFRETGAVSICSTTGPLVAIRTTGGAADVPLGICSGTQWRGRPSREFIDYAAAELLQRFRRDRKKLDELTRRVLALDEDGDGEEEDNDESSRECCEAVVVPKSQARTVKLRLGRQFRKEFSIWPVDEQHVAIPVHPRKKDEEDVVEALELRRETLQVAKRRGKGKKSSATLESTVIEWLRTNLIFSSKCQSWSKLGDDALLVPVDFCAGLDNLAGLWAEIADATRTKRLFRDAEVSPDGIRSSQRSLLHGSEPWVTIREDGIKFSFNACRTMFCFGNNTERMRHGNFQCREEIVVDLYAGIGYFLLPMLRAGAKRAYACEWSPDTAKALRKNIVDNGFQSQVDVYESDNQIAPIGRVADRVSLGLTPTSRGGWPVACRVVSPTGAILHVHENHKVLLKSEDQESSKAERYRASFDAWGLGVAGEILKILDTERPESSPWTASCLFVSRVKSYAPHVFHLVADIDCRPRRVVVER